MKIRTNLVLINIIFAIFFSGLLIMTVIKNVPLALAFLISIFIITFLYSLFKVEKRTALMVFLVSMFTFLIGRDVLYYYFDFGTSIYNTDINIYSYNIISISIVTILISTIFIERINFSKEKKIEKSSNSKIKEVFDFSPNFKKIVLISYYIIAVASIAFVLIKIKQVRGAGYLILYSESLRTSHSLFETILLLINIVLPVSLSLSLVIFKVGFHRKLIILTYLLYIILSLGTGYRHEFVLGILFLFFINICGKSTIKDLLNIKFLLPLFLVLVMTIGFSQVIANVRMDQNYTHKSIFDVFFNFFYDQGVSINVLKQAKILEHLIPENKIYTLKFLYSGIPARVFNLPIYYGNTIENAIYGNDLNHTLSYLVLGNNYLLGMGTGSSYIAEVMHDGGYFYLIIMNFIYALLLNRISQYYKYGYIKQTLYLLILPSLLWAPRGNATAFIADLIAPSVILFVVLIVVCYKIFQKKNKSNRINNITGRLADV
ncbi:O-antigen polysaccharide polymerase Wzy family protein [Globicatella sp. HMSC072A10]|uniref:O-antigen polysaccharide polymerase Wzy family protein n=1 Tax=Globicatella sp. HMSC072A10 TaxID=1739315 RepID=UPI0008C94609|nr:O-antigen polysaccharide polymerase Wzy family protein [Globicatella sp. HMSC072A10]OFK60925.1 hypothetical protein HMPREF2811_03425 [Globicatella sp. HMSC072A10]